MAGTFIDIPAADSGAFKGRSDVEINVYEGAGHRFHCDERGSCNAAAAKLARERSIAFLKKTVA